MKFKILIALSLLGVAGVCVERLAAQGTTATVLGTVTDASGAAVPEAAVQVKNVNTGITQSVSADGQGRFRVPDLGVGDYEVQASKTGFSTVVRRGITLTVGAQSVVDFSLPVGQQQQTVTVEGQVSQVETTNAAISTFTSEKQMRELPLNGRNFEQLIQLAPGVATVQWSNNAMQGRAAQYSVAGGRPEGQAIMLDDENLQSFWNNGISSITGSSLGVEAIGEFQTLTNAYSAQFGGNGAVINASADRARTASTARPSISCATMCWMRVMSSPGKAARRHFGKTNTGAA
jgi:carboxypeptidase family protein